MSSGPKPTQLGHVPPILLVDETIGVYTGDDVDWDGGGYEGVPAGTDQWKQPVRVATTASIAIATDLNSGDTLDGVTLATGDRVLVKDQSTGSQNGIYLVGVTPERAPDFDDGNEVVGAIVYVVAGTADGGKAYRVTNTTAPTIDSTTITFVAYIAGSVVSSLDDLSDVTLTTPVVGDRLRYDGSTWRNSPALWAPVMVEDGATGLWYVAVTGDGDAVLTEVS